MTPSDELRRALDEHRAVAAGMDALLPAIATVAGVMAEALAGGGRVFAFGNGGSAAEAQHLVAELVGRARRERRPLAAFALSADSSTVTALGNDYGFAEVFARQVEAHVRAGDVVAGISTSGASKNVMRGLEAANERGAISVLVGGGDGGPAAAIARHAILVPSRTVARVQEMHTLVIHLLCEGIDEDVIVSGRS
ncbi:MAG TPA: SIS domain-containing protein [Candidatus Limnocylindria bacterium]|nr:SIS domain-containing protein [Candidatus Limnocylindria bacterium]